eukprot:12392-Heterococcus_DN1.PRE.5
MAPTKSQADVEAIDDLCSLESCTDQTVIEHLELRWRQRLPYTQLGGIVVAVNPHKWLDIYSDERAYVEGQSMPAHIFKTSATAYRALLDKKRTHDQTIMISGVAGSGKTETAKLIQMRRIALAQLMLLHHATCTATGYTRDAVCICVWTIASWQICIHHTLDTLRNFSEARGHLASVAGAGATSDAEARRQLMEDSQRLLEAFSNAAVAGNDNSSRAGVVTDLLFDGSSGVPRLTGAKTTALLLEKSRVVAHAKGEGSFHVLHQLLDAEDNSLIEELQLQGLEVEDIPYLQNDPPSVGAGDSANERSLESTLAALDSMGVSKASQKDLLRALAGILHLGRVSFDKTHVAEGGVHEDS